MKKTDGISYRQGFSTTKLLHANANCVNGEYCCVSRVSIKISFSVIREELHLLKQTGKKLSKVFQAANLSIIYFFFQQNFFIQMLTVTIV